MDPIHSPTFAASSATSSSRDGSLLARVEEKIAYFYYKHGLICSRHPWIVMIIVLTIVAITSYPILGIHYLLGASSQHFLTDSSSFNKFIQENDVSALEEFHDVPRWMEANLPFAYIQQIIIKSAVVPWQKDLVLMDAIRAPLAKVFSLIESISNYQVDAGETKLSLDNVCFQVSEPISRIDQTSASYLPTYSCLMLSPANVWQNDINKFLQDSTIIKTLYSIKDLASPDSSGSLREALFGVPWMETGIRRLYVRTRQRTITMAVTIVMSKYNVGYLDELKNFLQEKYKSNLDNLTEAMKNLNATDDDIITHLYFKNQFTFSDFIPLGATYLMLFLYVYFSVRKIDMVKNKWVLALSSVMTVIMSLLMSLGICLRCGFNPTLNGSYILPYLVVVIGLENMLVMTKSVVSTPAHLDIKVRVAQGLSREGWYITKNLMTEITLLTIGIFTFVPIIQEFCLFATVGLLSDFFLQLSFFVTVLSIDIQRLELNGYMKNIAKATHSRQNSADANFLNSFGIRNYPTNVFARPAKPIPFKMPKRLRVVYFVANTRLVQRALMLLLIGWIILFVYKSGLMEHLRGENRILKSKNEFYYEVPLKSDKPVSIPNADNSLEQHDDKKEHFRLKDREVKHFKLLSYQHWSAIFGYYNLSLSGKYISILPPIHMSIPVSPDSAIANRHPSESDPQIFRQFISTSGIHPTVDPNDEVDDLLHGLNGDAFQVPWTNGEIFITVALSIPSIIFISYLFVVMYRCMCTRNYAEWRASWSESIRFKLSSNRKGVGDAEMVIDTNIVRLQEHEQEIEQIASNSDTPFVISCCMQSDVCVWDVYSGDWQTIIRRSSQNPLSLQATKKAFHPQHRQTGSFSSDSTYGSSPGNNSNEFQLETPELPKTSHYHHQNDNNYQPSNGYNFAPFCSKSKTSRDVISDLVLNAVVNSEGHNFSSEVTALKTVESSIVHSTIWCIEITGKLIIAGCANGRIEVWDSLSGDLLYFYEENNSGVTALKATKTKLVVARLNGTLEIFNFETINGFSINVMSSSSSPQPTLGQTVRYNLQHSIRAHLQPITSMQIASNNIITGSLDHLLKVYRLDTASCLFTLHGHCGGITVIHVDQCSQFTSISGCQVGQVCVWDIMTGTCVFSLEAHQDASVSSVLATPLYFISSGTDNRICIWDKYLGHLVHSIPQHYSVCKDMLLLMPNVLVTAREDHLVLWDISEATPIRMIDLNLAGDKQTYIKCLKMSSQNKIVVCDFGKQLCAIHFPGIIQKND